MYLHLMRRFQGVGTLRKLPPPVLEAKFCQGLYQRGELPLIVLIGDLALNAKILKTAAIVGTLVAAGCLTAFFATTWGTAPGAREGAAKAASPEMAARALQQRETRLSQKAETRHRWELKRQQETEARLASQFAVMDANKDGRLTKEEALLRESTSRRFASYDANKDSFVTLAEIRAYFAKRDTKRGQQVARHQASRAAASARAVPPVTDKDTPPH
jgi:hypothetical protein